MECYATHQAGSNFFSFLHLIASALDVMTCLQAGGMRDEGLQCMYVCIVGSWGASQQGGSLLGIPPGYKANKL